MSQTQLIINPFPKQQEAWEALLDDKHTYVVYGGAAGGGKAQPLSSLISTPNGFIRMGDIKIGDEIHSNNGGVTKVIAIHPQSLKDIFEIEFIDGTKTKTTGDHLWECWIASNGRNAIRTTFEIKRILENTKQNVIIPLTDPVYYKETVVPIDPYVLGVLLGDGGLTKHLTLTSMDDEIVNRFNSRLPEGISIRKTQDIQFSIVADKRNKKGYPVNPLADEFKKLGLLPIKCENRFIPEVYLYNNYNTRLEVLRGLMDTDGYIDSRGHISFCSKSEELAKGVAFIVRSLGGKATITKTKKRCKDFVGEYYNVYINTKINSQIFTLLRKKNRVQSFNGGVSELGKRIISIKQVETEASQCITVSNSNGLYLTNDFTVTHNSWLGCEWLLVMCLKYPGSRWFIGRDELKKIMTSAFITFTKVCSFHKISPESWKVNGQYNYIEFSNGSRIDLLDMKLLPTDPMFERFGSMEYTGGWLEEAGELHANAFEILKSRIGRHMADECPPKVLITCNPKKNWLYYDFYIPWKEGKLPDDALFIPALFGDNPYTKDVYGKQLMNLKDHIMRQRLEYGNWDYDDDNTNLLSYDEIQSLFTNKGVIGDKFMTVDPAFAGKDEAIIMLWNGWVVYKIISIPKTDHGTLMQLINLYAQTENVPKKNIVADAAGEGGYLPQMLKGIRGFLGGSSPLGDKEAKYKELEKPYFANLRTQCIYEMAHLIKQGKVQMSTEDNNIKTKVIQELQQWRVKAIDDDKKLAIVSKDDIRRTIGRSTDYSDALYMRMFFDLDTERSGITQETARKQAEVQRQVPFNRYGI